MSDTLVPKNEDKYKKYMDDYVKAYDESVKNANKAYKQNLSTLEKQANNELAGAGAGYNELTRNINEINKANGRANTGYAGDTSTSAYNAFRNSVNDIYNEKNTQTGNLYSYYIKDLMTLNENKQDQINSQRTLELAEKEYADNQIEKEQLKTDAENEKNMGDVMGYLERVNEDDFGKNGNIKAETAKKLWDIINIYYPDGKELPKEIQTKLSTYDGWDEWFEIANQVGTEDVTSAIDKVVAERLEEEKAKWLAEYKLQQNREITGIGRK